MFGVFSLTAVWFVYYLFIVLIPNRRIIAFNRIPFFCFICLTLPNKLNNKRLHIHATNVKHSHSLCIQTHEYVGFRVQ